MQQASLLYYSAKPQSGGILGYVRTIRFPTFCRSLPSVGAYSQYFAWSRCRRSADIPRADHDRVSWSPWQAALRSEILDMPFFHLFDFFGISKCSHRFRLQAQKDHWCDRPFLAKNNSLPHLLIQSRWDTHPKNWNYALKLKIDTQK